MNEDFNVMFDNYKNKDLLAWIKDYENKFYTENKELSPDKKEFFEKVYNRSKNVRNYFYNNYLSDISDNLNSKSNKNTYEYENFFKQVPPKEKKKYYEFYEKEHIENYSDDNDNDNDNNYSNKKIIKEQYNNKKYLRNKNEDLNDENKNRNKRIEENFYRKNENIEESNEEENTSKNNKNNNSILYRYYKYKRLHSQKDNDNNNDNIEEKNININRNINNNEKNYSFKTLDKKNGELYYKKYLNKIKRKKNNDN